MPLYLSFIICFNWIMEGFKWEGKVIFNNRLYEARTEGEKVYLTDISDNKIKIHISYSTRKENRKKFDDAMTQFWTGVYYDSL
ncbi:hypothetical protein D8M04_11175 [Oceanobacillus piezotolerans]|uniref:Uncharacterized protein n=1 Tax=Oceanobacillus piezotolerans TaxID=2448030 RepID=A0A498D9B7_9BACI|nr:hypothetical protein D8M04_11175 [Oceanobacillus piezotolerans]